MTSSTMIASGGRPQGRRGCRVSERFECDVPVSCQPPSGWGGSREIKWQARLRDVSAGGLCLVLQRRFERGAGLAIDLPAEEGATPCTILARVVHVRAEHGGTWALGCCFVSPLSEDELNALRNFAQADHSSPSLAAPAPPSNGTSASGIHFQGRLPNGTIVRRYIKSLTLDTNWPPHVGRTFKMRLRGSSGKITAVRVRVDNCHSSATGWVLECTILTAPVTNSPSEPQTSGNGEPAPLPDGRGSDNL